MLKSFKHPKCSSLVERALNRDGGLHLLNTTIIPTGADGVWNVETVELAFLRHCLLYLGHSGLTDFAVSHIGHQATADVLSDLLEQKIPVDRTPWDGSGVAFAIQLNGRLPEGQILSRPELEALGYSLRVMVRAEEK